MSRNVQSDGTVGKALDVLDQVARFDRPVRFSDLLERSSYPKATLYRLLQTLVHQGMVSYDPDRSSYQLGVRLVGLAHQAWRQSSLAPIARAYVDKLSRSVGETVHLAQMDNAQVLYVDKRNSKEPVEMYSQAGKVGPVYCTGIGKAMLAWQSAAEIARVVDQQSFHRFTGQTLSGPDALRAELEAIRARGYALDNEEHEPGIICVALPILSQTGRVMGGLSLTSTTSRHSLTSLQDLVPEIETTVGQIAKEAEKWLFPDNINEHA